MKNRSTVSKMLLIIFVSLTSFIPAKIIKQKKTIKKSPVVLICSCNTPANPVSSVSGSTVTLSWDAVAGAICYSYGGTYTSGGGFSGNTGGTSTSVTIPYNGGGIWQVRAICEGTCTNATCSSSPTGPTAF